MRDIVVTTPKDKIKDASKEASYAIASVAKGNAACYYRVFKYRPKGVEAGSRVYYVEDGWILGYALVAEVLENSRTQCEWNRVVRVGCTVYMKVESWTWVQPIRMRGFQGFRYAGFPRESVSGIGTWLDPKPIRF